MGSWLQYWNSQHGLLRLTSHISDRPSPSCSKQTHYSSQNDIFECFFKSLIFPFISRFTSSTPWTILFSYLEYGYNFWSVRPYSGVILTKSKSDQGILMHKAHQRFSTAQTRGLDMIFSLGIFLSCPLLSFSSLKYPPLLCIWALYLLSIICKLSPQCSPHSLFFPSG